MSLFSAHFSFPCWLLVFTLYPLQGTPQAPEPTVSITFQAIGWTQGDTAEGIGFFTGGEWKELSTLRPTLRSDSYSYRGPRELVFYRKEENPEGEPIPVPVAQLRVPENMSRVLLVFFSEEGGRFRILPMRDDLNHFPPGSYMFINVSEGQFAVKVMDDLKQLAPRETALFRIAPGEVESVELQMAKRDSDEWEAFHQTTLPHHDSRRVIMFLVEKEVRGRTLVQMRQLADYVHREKEPQPTDPDS